MAPWIEIGLLLVGAWLMAGVVNYLADVLPRRRKLERPFCVHCQAQQSWLQIWLWPRRCAACGKAGGWRNWAVFLALAGLYLALRDAAPSEPGLALSGLTLAYFVLVAVIDIEHHLILHVTSLFGAALGALVGGLLHGWQRTLIGGVAGLLVMLAFYLLGIGFVWLLSRLRGQPLAEAEGLGFGDVLLGGVLGLFLGWQGILAGLLLAILLAGAASLLQVLIMLARRKYVIGYALPYGPFMVLGATLLLFWGEGLLKLIY